MTDLDSTTVVLTTYLTDSAVAPLNKEFVEIPEPYWCEYLSVSWVSP